MFTINNYIFLCWHTVDIHQYTIYEQSTQFNENILFHRITEDLMSKYKNKFWFKKNVFNEKTMNDTDLKSIKEIRTVYLYKYIWYAFCCIINLKKYLP